MHVKLSRREAITVLAGAGVAMHGSKASAAANESLGAIAAANGFVFGAAAGPVIDKDIAYRELYTTHTRIVTTDIAMKMGTIAPQSGPKRFESADRLLQFCAANQDSYARSLSHLERVGSSMGQEYERAGTESFLR